MERHEQDVTNFSPLLAHRMPTVSASQALQELNASSSSRRLSTGLDRLDSFSQERDPTAQGVIFRGQITEIYGPPGVGKTAFAMQIAAKALCASDKVIWLSSDCASQLPSQRFKEILSRPKSGYDGEQPLSFDDLLNNMEHFTTPTLPHLLTLLLHPTPDFPAEKASLLVIDSISTVFTLAFPRIPDEEGRAARNKKYDAASQWASSRRWAVMSTLITKLGKLAALKNVAILILNQTVARVKAEMGAVLLPAISSTGWDAGVNYRIVMFRDWIPQLQPDEEVNKFSKDARFASVLKAGGVVYDNLSNAVPFIVEHVCLPILHAMQMNLSFGLMIACMRKKDGLREVQLARPALASSLSAASNQAAVVMMTSRPKLKRKREEEPDEVGDTDMESKSSLSSGEEEEEDITESNTMEVASSDEEYGWEGDGVEEEWEEESEDRKVDAESHMEDDGKNVECQQ